jgi:hypothetical protein
MPIGPELASGRALQLSASRAALTKIERTQGQRPVKLMPASDQSVFAFFSISKFATASLLLPTC